jgi:hypothetical protein
VARRRHDRFRSAPVSTLTIVMRTRESPERRPADECPVGADQTPRLWGLAVRSGYWCSLSPIVGTKSDATY